MSREILHVIWAGLMAAALWVAIGFALGWTVRNAQGQEPLVTDETDALELATIAGEAARDALVSTRLAQPLGFKALVCQSDFDEARQCVTYYGRQ